MTAYNHSQINQVYFYTRDIMKNDNLRDLYASFFCHITRDVTQTTFTPKKLDLL